MGTPAVDLSNDRASLADAAAAGRHRMVASRRGFFAAGAGLSAGAVTLPRRSGRKPACFVRNPASG
jgi:hypothetical protein